MADHDRIAQSVCDLSKTDRWATVAVVPNTAVIGPTAPADARGGTVRSGKGFIKRFAAATAAVGVARRSNRISNGVLQDKSIAEAAEVAAWPGSSEIRGRNTADHPGRESHGAAVVAGGGRKSAVAQKTFAERIARAGKCWNVSI